MFLREDVTGTDLRWHSEEGWGVLLSPELEGTAFAHFSAVELPDYRYLEEGQTVQFQYVTLGQDGCDHRATYVKLLT
jgi:cold shock protein